MLIEESELAAIAAASGAGFCDFASEKNKVYYYFRKIWAAKSG